MFCELSLVKFRLVQPPPIIAATKIHYSQSALKGYARIRDVLGVIPAGPSGGS